MLILLQEHLCCSASHAFTSCSFRICAPGKTVLLACRVHPTPAAATRREWRP